jgi:RimJ/RimL family protein N-acetyltransferase
MNLDTERLRLRSWTSSDADAFARMNDDPEVTADLGGPLSRAESDRKLARFQRSFDDDGITRWVVTDHDDRFLGYCGIVVHHDEHPLGAHSEIGWRLVRTAWGHGYATEAAGAALDDAFERVRCSQVLAYTSADNTRSLSVLAKLGLRRCRDLDFTHHYDGFGLWHGLVWVAIAPSSADPLDA